MTVVVIGGTRLIGSKLVKNLGANGHEAVPASPDTGVNTLTGEGLTGALEGAAVIVDVSNSTRRQQPAGDITWRCRSSAPGGWPRAAR